jgi:hypothetical protein
VSPHKHKTREKSGRVTMLVLTRRLGESIAIGEDTEITILNLDKKQVDLGLEVLEGRNH